MVRSTKTIKTPEKIDMSELQNELSDVAKKLEVLKETEKLPRKLERDIQTLIISIDQFTNK